VAWPTTGRKLRAPSGKTPAERILWEALRDRKIEDARFRRQAPASPGAIEFACFERKLVVALDAGLRVVPNLDDEKRVRHLASRGYRVLRVWQGDVLSDLDAVIEAIRSALAT